MKYLFLLLMSSASNIQAEGIPTIEDVPSIYETVILEVSYYPMETKSKEEKYEAVEFFIDQLKDPKIILCTNMMSTYIYGTAMTVWGAVMMATVSTHDKFGYAAFTIKGKHAARSVLKGVEKYQLCQHNMKSSNEESVEDIGSQTQ